VRMSWPRSRRWVAKEWRKMWQVTRLSRPHVRAASVTARCGRGLVQVMAALAAVFGARAPGGGEDLRPQRIAGRTGNLPGNGVRQRGRSPSGGEVFLVHQPRGNDPFVQIGSDGGRQ
jgi:hypothetical protein